MKNVPEHPFLINGVKSWIHCLEMIVDDITKKKPSAHHYHDYIELLYAIDVSACVWINGEKNDFQNGDLIIINSNEPHALAFSGPSKYICIKFLPHILYADENSILEFKYAQPFLFENSQQHIFHPNDFKNIDVTSVIDEIITEWKKQDTAFELVIRANILKLFSSIFRTQGKNSLQLERMQLTDAIKNALQYIGSNFNTVTEKEVAAHCNISYHYFSTLFKNAVGKSFSDYVTILKLKEAEKLLLTTDKSITEIGNACGFSTSSYFIAKFKKYKSLTPKQYKDKHRIVPSDTNHDYH